MVDVAVVVEPVPEAGIRDVAITVDPLVVTKRYIEIEPLAEPAAAPPDTTPPVISNFVPAAGTELAPTDTVQFDATDDSGLFARIMIAVAFADGTQELVYDGEQFTARYTAGSSVTTISGGFRFVAARTGGWLTATLTVRGFAIDAAGNTES